MGREEDYFNSHLSFMIRSFDEVLSSIDDVCELEVALFRHLKDGNSFLYLAEQSSLQALRELPIKSKIQVTYAFSERHRIAQRVEEIKAIRTLDGFFNLAMPLVENGNFPCTDISIIINDLILLESHDDGEVHLTAPLTVLKDLAVKILTRQGYDRSLFDLIVSKPELYNRLQKPNTIIKSYSSFDKWLDDL